jgi:hypothetical protein
MIIAFNLHIARGPSNHFLLSRRESACAASKSDTRDPHPGFDWGWNSRYVSVFRV